MDLVLIEAELKYQTSRSSGKGGQHVNKVETRVEVIFDVEASVGLSAREKSLVFEKLAGRISTRGLLRVADQSSRSQVKNKLSATEKICSLIKEATQVAKKRVARRVSAGAKNRRVQAKKRNADKKRRRSRPDID